MVRQITAIAYSEATRALFPPLRSTLLRREKTRVTVPFRYALQYCLFWYLSSTRHIAAHSDGVWGLAWSKSQPQDRELILTASVDGTVKVWNWYDALDTLYSWGVRT